MDIERSETGAIQARPGQGSGAKPFEAKCVSIA